MRIIPARAGFTHTSVPHHTLTADHPRSRGVYGDSEADVVVNVGSSPLARGLQARAIWPGPFCGIIPARAGFTLDIEEFHRLHPDHPRSRGVYICCDPLKNVALGSSPLARGLPFCVQYMNCARRIIPARAGFTLADPWNPNEPVLYQTPVAFTADLGSAPPSCGSAVVVPRWTTTPSGA